VRSAQLLQGGAQRGSGPVVGLPGAADPDDGQAVAASLGVASWLLDVA
jgi:hypothetical protein